jgi:hypothetical protein
MLTAFGTQELVVFSIEDRIWDDQTTSVADAVVRMRGQSREAFRRVCTRGCDFWDDLKAPALQRHFWVRNAPYAVKFGIVVQVIREAFTERSVNSATYEAAVSLLGVPLLVDLITLAGTYASTAALLKVIICS